MSRATVRAALVAAALPVVLRNRLSGKPRTPPRRILIAQLSLLGDTLMLAGLMAKLRTHHREAAIAITVPQAYAELFAGRPYGVEAIAWNPRDMASLRRLRAAGPFDLALVPADNRFGWLAAAAGARSIVGFAGDARRLKTLPLTVQRPLPGRPAAFGDFAATLIDGEAPVPYRVGDWPPPPAPPVSTPAGDYAVLHLGASSPHKLWPADRWQAALALLQARGLSPVLVAGRGEDALCDAVDPARRLARHAGTLGLAQYWHLLAGARLLLCPDTGIAHLARLAGTPTVALFGPGSPVLFGAGDFWREAPYTALWDADVPCRDQHAVFEKPLPWARQCWRSTAQCGDPRCIRAITVEQVRAAIDSRLQGG